MNQQRLPTTAEFRKALRSLTAGELDEWCQDHVYTLAQSFAPRMPLDDRIGMVVDYYLRKEGERERLARALPAPPSPEDTPLAQGPPAQALQVPAEAARGEPGRPPTMAEEASAAGATQAPGRSAQADDQQRAARRQEQPSEEDKAGPLGWTAFLSSVAAIGALLFAGWLPFSCIVLVRMTEVTGTLIVALAGGVVMGLAWLAPVRTRPIVRGLLFGVGVALLVSLIVGHILPIPDVSQCAQIG